MRITTIEHVQGDGGWQTWSFLKITTDEGLVGWSEFTGLRVGALPWVIHNLAAPLIGQDPRQIGKISSLLEGAIRLTDGGLNLRATAAIENACLDIKAKALGVPVYELFGGAVRDRIPLYWSHCGLYRAMVPDLFEKTIATQSVRRLDDLRLVAAEATAKGYKHFKTNFMRFDQANGRFGSTMNRANLDPGRNLDASMLRALRTQLEIMRDGAGPDTGMMLDLNFSFKPDGFHQVARALEDLDLSWLEFDLYEPSALASVRQRTTLPIASLEAIYTRRHLLPYLSHQAVDVAIIDMMWNGLPESVRMASLADTFQVNVAVHTAGSPFHAMMGAHFAAAIPNLKILEYDADIVPWAEHVFSALPVVENGQMLVPTAPGWGIDINEDALKDHPVSLSR
ncbi:MAG TPA: mandelate racemase/muconate lactonizing enzyme family protein [Sphingobium sp.]|nr:mandelate racemase/muconate lactonizing enzyme family protein [Sphingobium sp.]